MFSEAPIKQNSCSALWNCGKTADRIRMPFGIIGRRVQGSGRYWGLAIGPREAVLLGANLGCAIVTNGDFTAYVCNSAATWPSSQITLGKLVIFSNNRETCTCRYLKHCMLLCWWFTYLLTYSSCCDCRIIGLMILERLRRDDKWWSHCGMFNSSW